jgi:AbrB family looped-hinge helix DNA binding protein
MNTLKISPRFQMLIPHKARKELRLRAGQKVRVFVCDGLLTVVPIRPMREMRGVLRGMDTTIEREGDRF